MSSDRLPKAVKAADSVKKIRKSLSLGVKLDVLKRLDAGQRQLDVSKAMGLAGSTVRTIMRNAEKIKKFGKVATSLSASKLSRTRSVVMVDMERLLSFWIQDQTQRGIPLNLSVIQDKARSLYESLKKDLPEGSDVEEFTASRGWYERFKRRAQLHNLTVSDEVAATSDVVGAALFKVTVAKMIEEEGYTPQQVFSVDETGLFWKRMPSRSYLAAQERAAPGFKASKERLTLLLGGNAAGDFKLKPLLVYHSENPRALKGFSKGCLPVLWKANRKAWITRQVFDSWFTSYFCPAVKEYCAQNNLAYKALLFLDNAPCHPTTLDDLSHDVKVIFLPSSTTAMLQPMDQGVMTAFKTYYARRTFYQATKAIEGDRAKTLEEFWKGYNIRHAIENITSSWDEVSAEAMNAAWRKLWSECVTGEDGLEEHVMDNIIELARRIGMDNLEPSDIRELVDSHREELSDEELIAMGQQRALEEDLAEDDDENAPARTLTTDHLERAFTNLEKMCVIISENDPNIERSSKVIRALHIAVQCYKDLYGEKVKVKEQMTMNSFLFAAPSRTASVATSASGNSECPTSGNEDSPDEMIVQPLDGLLYV